MRRWWCVKEKKHKMALLLITFTIMLQLQIKGCVSCLEAERIGLLELKSYLTSLLSPEEGSILNSWSDDDPTSDCCVWERVKCSNGHIVDLSLGEVRSDYNMPESLNLSLLHSFPQLQSLNFSWNHFDNLFDPIHGYKSFQRLEKLRTLDLSYNHFKNSILPFLNEARSLRTLNLSDNELKGVFPPEELANMTELKVLDLQYNRFSLFSAQGLINFRELQELDLSSNIIDNIQATNGLMFPSSLQVLILRQNQLSLTSKGYSEICRLMNLRELDLRNNALTNMPYCLGNLTHLRTLELSRNQLDGNPSSFVYSLPSSLEYLSLLHNNFNGSFSFNSLVNHTRLEVFKLSSNIGMIQRQHESSRVPLFQLKILMLQNMILGSTIPEFLVHQRDLYFVDLSNSNLMGEFPTWLVQNNTRLQALLLRSNSLTKLQLPKLPHGLEVLDISRNRIFGSVQEDIGIVFPNLKYMNFASNRFQGVIPSSMGEMKSLDMLDMSDNGLSGKLPTTFLRGCYSLTFLKLSNNKFQGEIFEEHTNLTALGSLALDGNIFNGGLGKGLLNSRYLFILDVSNNSISGALPLWIGKFSSLEYLNIRRNQLKGPFPRQLRKLHVIDISHNSFSGFIPKKFDFPHLTELRLQRNGFMGPIPDALFRAGELKVLDLGNNNFSGKIPNSVGKGSDLRVVLLGNNGLQSHIPKSICQLSKINLLDLSHNNFSGIIPSCFGNMSFGAEGHIEFGLEAALQAYGHGPMLQNWKYTSALNFDLQGVMHSKPTSGVEFLMKRRYETYQGNVSRSLYGLDLSSNQLSGEIPVEFGNLQNIVSLNFSNNRLTGLIPDSFSKLKSLESLDLSNNKLSGRIPPQLPI